MTSARVNVVSHNIGGGTTYGGGLYSDGMAPVGTVLRVVQANESDSRTRIHAVTLQEVLRSEFDYWLSMGWYGVFVPMTTADENKFRGNEDKGQAVFSRYPIVDHHLERLAVPEKVVTQKDFSLLCVQIDHPDFWDVRDTLWICTTHLWSAGLDPDGLLYPSRVNDETRTLQAKQISEYLDHRTNWSRKFILTGDFNTRPKSDAIDYLHRVNRDGTIGTAKFWEGDQSYDPMFDGGLGRGGRNTVEGRKIDYFFASHQGANPHNFGIDMTLHPATPNGGAPHAQIIRGWARWRDLA